MTTDKTFNKVDQKNAEGEIVDTLFNITTTNTTQETTTFSGWEVGLKIKIIEDKIKPLQEELNFLKSLK